MYKRQALGHEAYNEDTSRRIRRSLEGRFEVGVLPLRPIAGYEIIDEGRPLLEPNMCPVNFYEKLFLKPLADWMMARAWSVWQSG